MTKLDMGAAWRDTVNLLSSQRALVLAIAGLLIFVPALAMAWFGPQPAPPPSDATPAMLFDMLTDQYQSMLPFLLLTTLIGLLAQLAIWDLWLSPAGRSVGDALGSGLRLLPFLIIASLIAGLAMGIGLIALIIPGLYLWARFAVMGPALVARQDSNPLAIIRGSWDATRGNGWRVLAFMLVVLIITFIIVTLAAAVIALPINLMLPDLLAMRVNGVVEAAATTIITLLQAALAAAVFRQLAATETAAAFR